MTNDLQQQIQKAAGMGILANLSIHENRIFYDDSGSFESIAAEDAESLLCTAVEDWLVDNNGPLEIRLFPKIDGFGGGVDMRSNADKPISAPTKLEALLQCAEAVKSKEMG